MILSPGLPQRLLSLTKTGMWLRLRLLPLRRDRTLNSAMMTVFSALALVLYSHPHACCHLITADIAQAAWQGSPNLLNLSEEKRGSESIDAPDGRGYTALHIVASKVLLFICKHSDKHGLILTTLQGEDSAVKTLLLHGASTEKRDIYGNTALHWASGQGHHHIVQTLLEFGADPNSGNNQLETPLHWWVSSIFVASLSYLTNSTS